MGCGWDSQQRRNPDVWREAENKNQHEIGSPDFSRQERGAECPGQALPQAHFHSEFAGGGAK